MKSQNCSASSRCSATEISPTQGAAHLPMKPSRQGRPERSARRYTPALHDRMENTRSIRSRVSRIAHTCVYGPKTRSPLRGVRRVMCTRGTSSPMVTTRYG